MFSGDADDELQKLADSPDFPHRDAAQRAIRFRAFGNVADLVAIQDDPHPCMMTDVVFAMASAKRTWLNWVPMPSEAISNVANEVGRRRAQGEQLEVTRLGLSAAEPASAVAACLRVTGPMQIGIAEYPRPDIRVPLRPGRFGIWRYQGDDPVPAVPAPSAIAVAALREVAKDGKDEPWPTSTRREVLVDLAFGIEDWASDSALFALVTAAYREPALREEVRHLVRARLDAAAAANRLVTIGRSLAHLMMVTPGCTGGDRAAALAALADEPEDEAGQENPAPAQKRRWWQPRG